MAGLPAGAGTITAVLGIAGGATILAAFIPDLPWTNEATRLRLVLFNTGAIAIILAVSQRRAAGSPASRAVAAAAILANAWYLIMVVLSIGRPQPPLGDPEFRLVGFFAGSVMWLADSAFGVVALHDRTIGHAAALALAVGSILAFTGMDRLELARGEFGWLFSPLSLAGIALNGAGWILIGSELLLRRGRRMRREAGTA